MLKFMFRLQKVLEYRELTEQWSKDAYLGAQRARLEGDAELASLGERRVEMLSQPVLSLVERLALDAMLGRIDSEEEVQRSILSELLDEEARTLNDWIERKREREVLVKLKAREHEEWLLESSRKEQSALDEWAVLRRAS